MGRELIWHAESEALFESFDAAETDACLDAGCDHVTGHPKFELRFQQELVMQQKDIKVSATFTRDQLTGTRNPQGNELLAGQVIFKRLRALGVPVIGVLGVLAVEWGVLTISHEDGLDGDEWTYTYTGKAMPKEWIAKCNAPGAVLRLDRPLAQQMAEEEEL